MTARAYVTHNFAFPSGGVSVYLAEERPDGGRALCKPVEFVVGPAEPGVEAAVQPPTMNLTESAARALLDALAAHFGGISETQTLRKDYMAERARVDKLIDHLAVAIRTEEGQSKAVSSGYTGQMRSDRV